MFMALTMHNMSKVDAYIIFAEVLGITVCIISVMYALYIRHRAPKRYRGLVLKKRCMPLELPESKISFIYAHAHCTVHTAPNSYRGSEKRRSHVQSLLPARK